MFRFRLGSIPVEVHFFHLLVSAMLGWYFFLPSAQASGPAWLAEHLGDPGNPGYIQAVVLGVLAWMLIVFISVLIHELGHAMAYRAFGQRPSIALVSLGGVTYSPEGGKLSWFRRVVVSLAGPLSGFMLGVVCGLGYFFSRRGDSGALAFFLYWFCSANVFWTVLNLLPVQPLDGGNIMSTVLTRFFGRGGFITAQGLALVLSLAAVAWGLRGRDLIWVLLFGSWGLQAVRKISDALKTPSAAVGEAQAPLMRALEQAQAALSKNELQEARRLASSVLEGGVALTPALASRAHRQLGWVALKEGQGRAALDHFSQVQGQPVEPQALAAAFSLVGDETRALPLWEMAWRDTGDRTVMHEYAGSLIRAGKEAQALRLPGVNPASAFSFAERVLFIRGAYSEAAAMGEAALAHVPDPTMAYNAACAFARAHNVTDAVRLLHRARELGYRDGAYAASDEDLAPLHGHPAFEAWLTDLRQSASS
ncbi:MAG: site-2 protease family protein [Hyalangium sp.]|uniref:site-2 protease family protein n=1 Tax=Hyalangium sp. TaxID=2028555 RepID=UPI003899A0CA